VFNEGVITPNHLADVPLSIDPDTFRIEVKGTVDRPLSLSLTESSFEPVEIVAVNQCSGNGRGFFEPRVAGGQLANAAMGNASWRGVPQEAYAPRDRLVRGKPAPHNSAATVCRYIVGKAWWPRGSLLIMVATKALSPQRSTRCQA
jgi:Oxidoreductase molybdopterin binding domain